MEHFDKEIRKDGLYERRTSLPRTIQLDLSQNTPLYTVSASSSYDPDDEVFIEFEEWQVSSCKAKMDDTRRTRRTSDVIDSLGPDTAWPEASPHTRRTTSPDLRQTLHIFNDSTSQLTPRSDVGYWSGSVTSASSPMEPRWFRYSQSSSEVHVRRSAVSEGDDPLPGNTITRQEEDSSDSPSRTSITIKVKQPDTVDAQPLQPEQLQPPLTPSGYGRREIKEGVASVAIDSIEYKMTHAKRGIAVILNHEKFRTTSLPLRDGSKRDVVSLESLYKTLGFDVRIYHDLTCHQIYDTLYQLSQEDHSESDCLCVTVLTHGLDGQHLYAYDTPYSYDDLYTHFAAPNCLSLAGKPKIFVIQACRGSILDPGVRLVSRTTTDSAPSTSYAIPSMSDFLIANSTYSGFYSWRNPEEGTWYIQSLVGTMLKYREHLDLISIMTRVACQVATEYESFDDQRPDLSGMKQSPSIISTLIRQIYFRTKNL